MYLVSSIYSKLMTALGKSDFVCRFVPKNDQPQLVKYLVIGVSSVTLEFLLYHFFGYFTGPDKSNVIAVTIIFFYNYGFQKNLAFKSQGDNKKQVIMYALLFFFNMYVSTTLILFLIEHYSIHKDLAKLFATILVVSWNFIIYNKIIFKK